MPVKSEYKRERLFPQREKKTVRLISPTDPATGSSIARVRLQERP